GTTPTPWIEMSPGARYCAVVSLSPSLSSSDLSPKEMGDWMSNSTWTEPLPKVSSPMTTPRSRFLTAPATISEALAEFWLTSTASGTLGSRPLSVAASALRSEPATPAPDPDHRDEGLRLDEGVRHLLGLLVEPARVPAQVHDDALDLLPLEQGQRVAEVARAVGGEVLHVEVADLGRRLPRGGRHREHA